jgi:hypothetical protein
MRPGTPVQTPEPIRSHHAPWRDSRTSRTAQRGVTPSADATFSNATVDNSRATSRGVTEVLVAPRGLARQKGLLLGILVGEGLVLKF